MIKTQRRETDKKLEAIRTSLTMQETSAKADEKAKLPGALEVTLSFKAEPKRGKISLGEEPAVDFLGNVWAKINILPGRHKFRLMMTSEPVRTIERVAEIKADSLTKLELAVGE
jgi:hypothetical protein